MVFHDEKLNALLHVNHHSAAVLLNYGGYIMATLMKAYVGTPTYFENDMPDPTPGVCFPYPNQGRAERSANLKTI